MRFPANQSVSIDGEVTDIGTELHFSIKRGALRFIVPKGVDFIKKQQVYAEATV